MREAPQTSSLLTYVSQLNKNKSRALLCQREQSLGDNLIVFSTSPVFDVSGMVAIEQTIILLISLVFSNLPCLWYSSETPRPDAQLHLTWQARQQNKASTAKRCAIEYHLSKPQTSPKKQTRQPHKHRWTKKKVKKKKKYSRSTNMGCSWQRSKRTQCFRGHYSSTFSFFFSLSLSTVSTLLFGVFDHPSTFALKSAFQHSGLGAGGRSTVLVWIKALSLHQHAHAQQTQTAKRWRRADSESFGFTRWEMCNWGFLYVYVDIFEELLLLGTRAHHSPPNC